MAAGIIPVFSVGDRFRKARELTGMSRGEFAARLGVHRETVTRYEEVGSTKPQAVAAWAEITGVDPDWLMPAAVSSSAPDAIVDAVASALAAEHGFTQTGDGRPETIIHGHPADVARTAVAAALSSRLIAPSPLT